MIEIMKLVGKVKFITIKGHTYGSPGVRHLTKIIPELPRSLTHFKPAQGLMSIILKQTKLLESINRFYLYFHYSINVVLLIFS